MTQPEFQCKYCKVKYRSDAKKQKLSQTRKGCFEILKNPTQQYRPLYSMEGSQKIIYYKCPALLYSRPAADLINYYDVFNKGILPYKGTYYEQPAKFVELMELVNNLIEENKQSNEKKKQKYGKRS